MFSSRFLHPSMIHYHLDGPDDIIQNGRQNSWNLPTFWVLILESYPEIIVPTGCFDREMSRVRCLSTQNWFMSVRGIAQGRLETLAQERQYTMYWLHQCCYNMVNSFPKLTTEINILNSQKTPHTLPSEASYRASLMGLSTICKPRISPGMKHLFRVQSTIIMAKL